MSRPGVPNDRVAVTSPEAAAAILKGVLDGLDREHAVALLLDTKHRALTLSTVSIGTIDHTFLNPREVYRDALLGNASALVIAHNHPSGDPTPSRDDIAITRQLVDAGDLIGVALLDHIIIGREQWVSLAPIGAI